MEKRTPLSQRTEESFKQHTVKHYLMDTRLAAIDGAGGDTGVKPQHRYVTCPY